MLLKVHLLRLSRRRASPNWLPSFNSTDTIVIDVRSIVVTERGRSFHE
jgi:hypothetical protein